MKTYAGIGSRATPEHIGTQMFALAYQLAKGGSVLRSGGADGADSYFEFGASKENVNLVEIYDSSFGRNNNQAKSIAQMVINRLNQDDSEQIPNLSRMKPHTQGLIARNMAIILGEYLDDPCDFVVCWTPEGKSVGGTRYALKLCEMKNIPVYNYAVMNDKQIREILKDEI